MLGLDAPEAELARAFALAAPCPAVKGFAVGRTIFAEPARDWLAGKIDDAAAVDRMAERFAKLVAGVAAGPGRQVEPASGLRYILNRWPPPEAGGRQGGFHDHHPPHDGPGARQGNGRPENRDRRA